VRIATWRLVAAALMALSLAGCMVGPNYHRPDVPVASAWKEQPPWRVADPKDGLPKGQWWTIFGDVELSQYETQSLQANQTIEAARDQLQQARASVRITQSGLFPQITAGVTAARTRVSANQPTTTGVPLTNASTQNDVLVPFNLSWETDIFGGVRRKHPLGGHVGAGRGLFQPARA
jgi:outer membrane protein, multidrug efflux system